MAVSPARAAAFDILLRVERASSYASELLHSSAYENLSSPDHALATELVMGVLRWRSRLDDEIAQASSQPIGKLDLEILIALRLAVYQFRWLSRVPQRAAVHESVELVKRARKRSAASFVNAVLRKLAQTATGRAPQQEMDSPSALASSCAHPIWLVERWVGSYGLAAAKKICEHDQTIPDAAIRLRTPNAEEELARAGIALQPGSLLTSARRVTAGDVTKTEAFRQGKVIIQDEASQLVATLVGNGQRILDCCAAPGGKTLLLADHNPASWITAIELHAHRARLLRKLLDRAEPTAHIQVIAGDARHLPLAVPFDAVLVDVPCSGTGTLARNPDIRWRLTPKDLPELQQRQKAILESALGQLAPKGRLVYSTCSLEKEENEDVIREVLAAHPDFRLVDCRVELERLKAAGEFCWPDPSSLVSGSCLRTIPGVHPCDGFFAAILGKGQ